MGFSVRGHICIRRKAKDGEPGAAGKSIRTTVWETGKQFYAGDTQVDGVYPLDIVADKAISIGVSGVNFYMCRTSHTSSANIPLTNTAYWTKLYRCIVDAQTGTTTVWWSMLPIGGKHFRENMCFGAYKGSMSALPAISQRSSVTFPTFPSLAYPVCPAIRHT